MRPSTKVKDVMTTGRLVSVKPDDDVAFAARLMNWAGVRHMPVNERGGDHAAVRG